MSHLTRPTVDPFTGTSEARWGLNVPIIGEISSEATPEPISPITLKRIAAKGRVRQLPRIATLQNQGPEPIDEKKLMETVPQFLCYRDQRKFARLAARRLRKAQDLEQRIAVQPNCADCGIAMLSERRKGIAYRCAVVTERRGQEILLCQRCASIEGQRRPEDAA